MSDSMSILDLTIEDLFPNIFNRQYFFVSPNDKVYMACICLIPSIEIYIDGVVVIDNEKLVGMIGSKNILNAYYEHGSKILYKEAREIMYDSTVHIKPDNKLSEFLDHMRKHRLGFLPVINNSIIAVASIYDVLRLITKHAINISVTEIASKLLVIDDNYNIKDALKIMIEKNIRRLFFKEDDGIYAIVDRDILDFIVNNIVMENRDINIEELKINTIKKRKMLEIDSKTSISNAAILLLKEKAPSSLIIDKEYVVTAWDIVTKVKYK